MFAAQRAAVERDPYPSAQQRVEWLSRVRPMIARHRGAVLDALDADFGGHSRELAEVTELMGPLNRAAFAIAHVQGWMKPSPRPVDRVTLGRSRAYVRYEPKGVVGNMVSWNFPFDIGLGPTIDALAAGNRVVVKPSELAPARGGRVLAAMVADSFAEDELVVVTGDLKPLSCTSRRCRGTTWCSPAAPLWAGRSCARPRPTWRRSPPGAGRQVRALVGEKVTDRHTITSVALIKVIKHGQMCISDDDRLVPRAALDSFAGLVVDFWRKHFAADAGAASSCGIITDRHVGRRSAWWPTPGNVARR